MSERLPLQWWKVGGRPNGIYRWKLGGKPFFINANDAATFRAIYNFLEISPVKDSAAQIVYLIKHRGAVESESLSLSAAFKSNVVLERKVKENAEH